MHDELNKGASDNRLARYSLESGCIILSYDPDWITEFSEEEYHCVLAFEDQSLTARQVARIIHSMWEAYPESEFRGLQKAGRNWL